ncbi:MAG TPA: sigma-54 dependent transcriptional regulator [Thermoanaerobaculia bacterium]|nr:sigma-54 dependent transcriptional regulator [Thermoanaerobaculia bacterium]
MRAIVFSPEGRAVFSPLRGALRARGWDLVETSSEQELHSLVREGEPELVAIQVWTRSGEALALARGLRSSASRVPLLLITASCPGDLALAAMRAGFNDVLADGCSERDATEALTRVAPGKPHPAESLLAGSLLVGQSRAAEQLRHAIRRVAATDSNVLVTGETGTGKELTAELIHRNSRRRDKPFVSINCAAIPDGLLESELFGYERGAFTGAHAAREGKLQYAQGGTLFLDEVGDMNLYAQAKILRAIESRKVQRLGGHREIAVNIRIIAATNHNLEQLTSQQKFRQDLYFRLNVARIPLVPLRDHKEDIPELVEHLLADLAPRMGRRPASVDSGFLDLLAGYDWPGNVRELRNVIESTLVFCSAERITVRDLPLHLRALFVHAERERGSERERIVAALSATSGNRTEAARRLGCSRMTLYRKMVKYGLFPAGESEEGEACNSA